MLHAENRPARQTQRDRAKGLGRRQRGYREPWAARNGTGPDK